MLKWQLPIVRVLIVPRLQQPWGMSLLGKRLTVKVICVHLAQERSLVFGWQQLEPCFIPLLKKKNTTTENQKIPPRPMSSEMMTLSQAQLL